MNGSASAVTAERDQTSVLDTAAVLAACAVGALIFLRIGWMAMAPHDPLGPVSVLTRNGALAVLLSAAGLSVVSACAATLLGGRSLPDVGIVSVAIGLGLVSLQGGTSEQLLLAIDESSMTGQRALALAFAAESLAWFAVLLVAMFCSAAVICWCFGEVLERRMQSAGRIASDARRAVSTASPSADVHLRGPAGLDVPWLSCLIWRRSAAAAPVFQTPPAQGFVHTAVATIVALAAMHLFWVDAAQRVIRHGQVCFAVAASFCIAVYVAQRFAPVRSALWPLLSVSLAAVLGYVWAAVAPAQADLPPNIPRHHALRALPVQFVSVGAASAVAFYWRFSRRWVCVTEVPDRGDQDRGR